MKLIYIKRTWEELRGDEYDHWGISNWYFECDNDGFVKRQVEEYEIGIRLRYDDKLPSDKYGMLSDVPLDLSDKDFISIAEADFKDLWTNRNPSLCQTIDDETVSIEQLEKIETEKK